MGYLYRGQPRLAELNARIMAERKAREPITRPGAVTTGPQHGTVERFLQDQRQGRRSCPLCRKAAAEAIPAGDYRERAREYDQNRRSQYV